MCSSESGDEFVLSDDGELDARQLLVDVVKLILEVRKNRDDGGRDVGVKVGSRRRRMGGSLALLERGFDDRLHRAQELARARGDVVTRDDPPDLDEAALAFREFALGLLLVLGDLLGKLERCSEHCSAQSMALQAEERRAYPTS